MFSFYSASQPNPSQHPLFLQVLAKQNILCEEMRPLGTIYMLGDLSLPGAVFLNPWDASHQSTWWSRKSN
jgi:hypothetical protein